MQYVIKHMHDDKIRVYSSIVMAHVVKSYGTNVVSERRPSMKDMNIQEAENLVKMAEEVKANEREKLHVDAIVCMAKGLGYEMYCHFYHVLISL